MSNKKIEELIGISEKIALQFRHQYITLEHLLLVLMDEKPVIEILTHCGVDVEIVVKEIVEYLNSELEEIKLKPNSKKTPSKTQSLERVFSRAYATALFQNREEEISTVDILISVHHERHSYAAFMLNKHGFTKDKIIEYLSKQKEQAEEGEALEKFCINMKELVKTEMIHPAIGRTDEIDIIAETMLRKIKNNVILTGDPGVGKTAIVQGFVCDVVGKKYKNRFKEYEIYSLNMSALLAGTRFRGDLEERLENIFEAMNRFDNSILFIDEIQTIMQNQGNGADVANLLKPVLLQEKVKFIGACTDEEFRKYFGKDRAIERRFSKIDITEPEKEHTLEIVEKILPRLEKHHSVIFDEECIPLIYDLTEKFMPQRRQPDKILDAVDSSMAYINLHKTKNRHVMEEDIYKQVSKITKVSEEYVSQTSSDDKSALLQTLEERMKKTVFSQDESINQVVERVLLAQSGLKDDNRPIGGFLFVGPTGCGKTETARSLADALHVKLVKFDMSEYQERHSVSKLIGTPPGYIGYEDGGAGHGLLINELQKEPNCVLLLDEIEKAHQDVSNILLQMLDDSKITSSNGVTINCDNIILILTSNLGSRESQKEVVGFGDTSNNKAQEKAVNEYFSPEFRNRLDAVCYFNDLTKEDARRIAQKFIAELVDTTMSKHEILVHWEPPVLDLLVEKGFDKKMGARPMKRTIDKLVKVPLSKYLIFDTKKANINLVVRDNEIVINKLK